MPCAFKISVFKCIVLIKTIQMYILVVVRFFEKTNKLTISFLGLSLNMHPILYCILKLVQKYRA